MSKHKKTNAMRILESNKINYTTLSYDIVDDNFDGISVSHQVGLGEDEVYKTLVCHSGNQYFVCIIPVDKKLDLKALSKAANIKKLEMLPVNDILKVTGYIRGGCSPLGMKKDYPSFIDSSAVDKENIAVSAGIRGQQIFLNPNDLIKVAKLTVGEFAT